MPIESILAKKSLGILLHPSSIPGGRVCGTFGKGAKDLIKKLHKHGIEYWQFLPLTPTDSKGSPYSCLLYTSPSPRDGLLSRMPSSA